MTDEYIPTEGDLTFTEYDTAEIITSKEDVVHFLNQAFAEEDPEEMKRILQAVVRSEGFTSIAEKMGVPRPSVYKTLKPGTQPFFMTVVKLIHALGMQLTASFAEPSAESAKG